jgi:hypothetical protein
VQNVLIEVAPDTHIAICGAFGASAIQDKVGKLFLSDVSNTAASSEAELTTPKLGSIMAPSPNPVSLRKSRRCMLIER